MTAGGLLFLTHPPSLASLLLPLMSMADHPLPVTFAANGEYVVSGSTRGVQLWRVEDGKLLGTMEAEQVQCVAFSKDSRWIAAGTFWGDVMVWDAKIYKQIFTTWKIDDVIRGVDFSPDSSRLVALGDHTATVWNIATRERVVSPLQHKNSLLAAKYSPNGNRIAIATQDSVRVYDSNNGHLLVDIPVQVTTSYNTGLLWFNNHLFVVSDNKIKRIDASTWSAIWESPDASNPSCIAIPRHGEFIACSANRTVTFWDTSTHTRCGLVHHPQDIYSIALSPDGRFLAIGAEDEKITIKRLSRIAVSILASLDYDVSEQLSCPDSSFHVVVSFPHSPSQEPDIQIDDAALDQLADTEASLPAETPLSQNPSQHVLASRALARARLQRWDEAIADSEEVVPAQFPHTLPLTLIHTKSIAVQPSVMGYIAKSVSLAGKRKKLAAYRACDIAFEHVHSTHISFLLLMKVCIPCTGNCSPLSYSCCIGCRCVYRRRS